MKFLSAIFAALGVWFVANWVDAHWFNIAVAGHISDTMVAWLSAAMTFFVIVFSDR